jgi:hypothetical protein
VASGSTPRTACVTARSQWPQVMPCTVKSCVEEEDDGEGVEGVDVMVGSCADEVLEHLQRKP